MSGSVQRSASYLAKSGGSARYEEHGDQLKVGIGDGAIELYDSDYCNTTMIQSDGPQSPSRDTSSSLKSKMSREYFGNGVMRQVSVEVDYYKREDTVHKII